VRHVVALVILGYAILGGCATTYEARTIRSWGPVEGALENSFPMMKDVNACDLKTIEYRPFRNVRGFSGAVFLKTVVQVPTCGRPGIVYYTPLG
jgi:hypothetical protein